MRFPARSLSAIAVLALAAVVQVHSVPSPHAQEATAHTTASTEPVDINTATLDQLMKIPGLTRTWAARIIRFRPYRGKNELLDRGIVNAEVYARIKDHIVAHRARD